MEEQSLKAAGTSAGRHTGGCRTGTILWVEELASTSNFLCFLKCFLRDWGGNLFVWLEV